MYIQQILISIQLIYVHNADAIVILVLCVRRRYTSLLPRKTDVRDENTHAFCGNGFRVLDALQLILALSPFSIVFVGTNTTIIYLLCLAADAS